MIRRRSTAVVSAILIFLWATSTIAAPLSKADAEKILSFRYKRVAVAAVINGIGAGGGGTYSSANTALVFGICEEQSGSIEPLSQTMFFDSEMGWCSISFERHPDRTQLWSLKGYVEIGLPSTE